MQPSSSNTPSTALVLPVPNEQLGNFISRLLGSPQVIERRIGGSFEITSDDIINLHQILSQRIFSQNRGTEIECNLKIEYLDGSSVELKGVDQFISYAEVRSIISTGVTMSIGYLLHFEGHGAPERQQIDISMRTSEFGEFDIGVPLISSNRGRFFYRIQHTQRTWGFDIDNLLNHQLQSLLIQDRSGWMRLLRTRKNYIAFGSLIFYFVYVLYAAITISERAQKIKLSQYKEELLKQKQQFAESNDQVLLMLEFLFDKFIYTGVSIIAPLVFMLLGTVAFISVGLFLLFSVLHFLDTKQSGFILLTKKAKENRDEIKKSESDGMKIALAILFLNFFLGILGNIIAAKLT